MSAFLEALDKLTFFGWPFGEDGGGAKADLAEDTEDGGNSRGDWDGRECVECAESVGEKLGFRALATGEGGSVVTLRER